MENIIEKLAQLEAVSKQLEPNDTERHELNKKVIEFADNFIHNTEQKKSYFGSQPDEGSLQIHQKRTIDQLLDTYQNQVVEKGINPASGGHVGYIPGGGIYTAALADFLADVTNEYAGMFYGGPGAVTIENEVVDWLKDVFQFPKSAVGNLTSGGSIANLIALTAARDKHGIKNERITKSVIYLSEQVHHCIHKAIRIIGLEDIQIRYLKLDENSKIRIEDLQDKIAKDKAKGLYPFMVIASAGTTDTGAVDPLKEIGGIASEHNLWYHIDGAYGGFFILCKEKSELFRGIEMADSLVIDPHKGLFLPYGLGAVLVKDKEAVFHSHHYTANYMQDAVANHQLNPADVSPELTKHFRGLRLWLPIQLHGIEPFKACLEEKLLLTHYFRSELAKIGFELGPEPDLSVSYFWYPLKGTDENEFNKKLMEVVHADGRVFFSSTNLNGKFVIRMAILSFRTKKTTMDKAIEMFTECIEKTKEHYN